MKVAPKLVLAAWLAFLPVLGVHAWVSVRRQEALFRSDMERGLSMLGEHLRQIIVTEWDLNGEPESEALLAAAAHADRNVEIRWLSTVPPGADRGLTASSGDRMTWLEPVAIHGRPAGQIEISESLAPMHRHLHTTLLQIVLLSAALGVASALLARAAGERLIGRRLRSLVDFAKRTGAGHLGDRIALGGNDEISKLANSLGEMSSQLAEALDQTRTANAERLSMLQQLRHADRLASIGRLASSVAHELGTPLNVAMGHAQRIVKEQVAAPQVQRSAEVIHRQMNRMAATIQSVLGFARSTSPPVGSVDMVRVVESVRELLAPMLDDRHVALVTTRAPESARVRGSKIQLEQVISNLISNAADASGRGSSVEIAVERGERSRGPGSAPRRVIAVEVRDRGPGVPQEIVDRIFEPFFTSKPEGSGTGLGLWITQGIVHDHEGWIEFANLPGGGASFTVLIPEEKAT